jgi:small subunit ribosomal protein S6
MGRGCVTVRSYELAVVVDPTLDTEASEGVIERITKRITDGGGTIEAIDRWGRKRLAYEIDGHREGNYFIINFNCQPGLSPELERALRIMDGVIRYLLVKQGES